MRRLTSAVWLTLILVSGLVHPSEARADQTCEYNPAKGRIVCRASGGLTVTNSSTARRTSRATTNAPRPPLRYVVTGYDATIGDCYSWSRAPAGLDAWDPGNDPAVIAITTKRPTCPSRSATPATATDPSVSAWSVFRSWNLAAPAPSVTPRDHGITGIPSHIRATPPALISHSETLPDGRKLQVRARAALLTVSWGDGSNASFNPQTADGYPSGSVTHVYDTKTCSMQYRQEHPSGSLCSSSRTEYNITASYTWQGEYNVGSGWVMLGTLDRSAPRIGYDVDEARGVASPQPSTPSP
jgi:hypothetical protein